MSVSDVRRKTAEKLGEGLMAQCLRCHAPTPHDQLSHFGARCLRCYTAYCAQPMDVFNRSFKNHEPTHALPRREQRVTQGHIGELLAKRPTREHVDKAADELGIDIPDEYRNPTANAPEQLP